MKLNIFYSWQSDLPSSKNRGLIEDCVNHAMKSVFQNCKTLSEYNIESDSRNEAGTPDLVSSIFSKIDMCDIFVCDISIVNEMNSEKVESQSRRMPNPNVMIELGFASKSVGWSNIVCIFNKEFADIEDLPFDIRFRKPLVYDTSRGKSEQKKRLTNQLEQAIQGIIDARVIDKHEYEKTKRQVDLGMQSILIDFCKMLFRGKQGAERYSYSLLLNSTKEDISNILNAGTFLGFELFSNIMVNIKEFSDFFTDDIEIYFLSEKEKRLIVKMIYALRDYKDIMKIENLSIQEYDKSQYKVVAGSEINSQNPSNSYLLLKIIDAKKAVVLSSGTFELIDNEILLNKYIIPKTMQIAISNVLWNIVAIVNAWIKETGSYFIINVRKGAE